MTKFLTHETPGKVFSLLGIAIFSMAFLFSVNVTDAGFNGTHSPLPDPFSPDRVMAVLDTSSHAYSMFLNANLFAPLQQNYALVSDNSVFVAQSTGQELASLFGSSQAPATTAVAQAAPAGQVAGAHTNQPARYQNPGLMDLISSLTR